MMTSRAWYNENDKYAAQYLRNLIAAGLIADGDVDDRSIVDVTPSDLKGYTQCHFFAGLGGWSCGLRLAGWPDDEPVWTGSCPCQGESVAGKMLGRDDPRHLWPAWFPLIKARRPAVVMGEQVARAAGTHWFDGVCADMEGINYATRAAIVPACAVDAPHRRDRLWFVSDAECRDGDRRAGVAQRGSQGRAVAGRPGAGDVADDEGCDDRRRASEQIERPESQSGKGSVDGAVVNGVGAGLEGLGGDGDHGDQPRWIDPDKAGSIAPAGGGFWGNTWLGCSDGKARRVKPGVRLLAHGVSARVGKLRAFGNAIVPQVAAEIIAAYMQVRLSGDALRQDAA